MNSLLTIFLIICAFQAEIVFSKNSKEFYSIEKIKSYMENEVNNLQEYKEIVINNVIPSRKIRSNSTLNVALTKIVSIIKDKIKIHFNNSDGQDERVNNCIFNSTNHLRSRLRRLLEVEFHKCEWNVLLGMVIEPAAEIIDYSLEAGKFLIETIKTSIEDSSDRAYDPLIAEKCLSNRANLIQIISNHQKTINEELKTLIGDQEDQSEVYIVDACAVKNKKYQKLMQEKTDNIIKTVGECITSADEK